jgi:hypothetical protein
MKETEEAKKKLRTKMKEIAVNFKSLPNILLEQWQQARNIYDILSSIQDSKSNEFQEPISIQPSSVYLHYNPSELNPGEKYCH